MVKAAEKKLNQLQTATAEYLLKKSAVGFPLNDYKQNLGNVFFHNDLSGPATVVAENGDEYKGDFIAGKPEGIGEITFALGGKYRGKMSNGMPEGSGVYTFPDSATYSGEFTDGKMMGFGVLASGKETYSGEWKDNHFNGYGIYDDGQGNYHEGYYIMGKRQNYGKSTHSDGSVYAGQFDKDLPSGLGVWMVNMGVTWEGEFDKGVFVESDFVDRREAESHAVKARRVASQAKVEMRRATDLAKEGEKRGASALKAGTTVEMKIRVPKVDWRANPWYVPCPDGVYGPLPGPKDYRSSKRTVEYKRMLLKQRNELFAKGIAKTREEREAERAAEEKKKKDELEKRRKAEKKKLREERKRMLMEHKAKKEARESGLSDLSLEFELVGEHSFPPTPDMSDISDSDDDSEATKSEQEEGAEHVMTPEELEKERIAQHKKRLKQMSLRIGPSLFTRLILGPDPFDNDNDNED